jgi:hypothetical protein
MSKGHKTKCECSFCESELKMGCGDPVFCQPCSVPGSVCPKCGQKFDRAVAKCPNCGTAASRVMK